ncbi:MAG TPA: biotin/lipoyl-binding protein [Candidatus Fraserbacteria bacterium]|nr:biotin/lipoyl-binding protein [Candidatus Fraserbacteria bacterium]
MRRYTVEIAGQALEVVLEHDRRGRLWAEVEGQRMVVELRPLAGRALYTLIWGRRSIGLGCAGRGSGYRLQREGQVYHPVKVERSAVHALRRHLKGRSLARSDRLELRAHLPGLVVKVAGQPGQLVRQGQGLVIIEAMKMENELRAPCDCLIEAIKVKVGAEVKRGTLLCILRRS